MYLHKLEKMRSVQDNHQHFSHHHILIPLTLDRSAKIYCKACEEQILDDQFHGCLKCQHSLHDHCLNFPRSLSHPSHLPHPLTLLPKPTYSSRAYSCNACGSSGNSFSMSCAHCEFDLHLHCATLPQSLILDRGGEVQHSHQLKLIFTPPNSSSIINDHDQDDDDQRNICDMCHSMINQNHWLYYCEICDFSLHLDCAIPKEYNYCSKEESDHDQAAAATGARAEYSNSNSNQRNYYNNNNSYYEQYGNPWEKIEQIRIVSEAQDQLYAAAVKAKIEAQGRQAALDLLDPPRRYGYY